jgi:hypothetical protein
MRDRDQSQHDSQFIDALRGFAGSRLKEEPQPARLYDLLKPQVTKLVVCAPRKNASMREGHQNDKIDARRIVNVVAHIQTSLPRKPGCRDPRPSKAQRSPDKRRELLPCPSAVYMHGQALDVSAA